MNWVGIIGRTQRLSRRGVAAVALVALAACGQSASPAANQASPPAQKATSAAGSPQRGAESSAAAGGGAAGLKALIDGARTEGQLALVWGEGTEGGTPGIKALADGLNKQYGLNLQVQFTPGPSIPEMGAKLIQEYQTHRSATSDLYFGFAANFVPLVQADALEKVDWPQSVPNLRSDMVGGDGVAVAIEDSLPGITYNTNKIKGDLVPKSLQDLLKPEYKGRIASTPYAANFDYLSMDSVWGEQRTADYLRKFTKQVAGLIRCTEHARVQSGEFDILALDCGQGSTYELKSKGAPLDFVIPSDAPLLLPAYLGVPKNAAHPNAAKLWVNYVMSRQGQDILYKYDFGDSPLVAGSKEAPDLQKLQASGVKLQTIDLATMLAQNPKELARRRAEMQKILKSK